MIGRLLAWALGQGSRAKEMPVPRCDPKCPRQRIPHNLSDCECGGAEAEYEDIMRRRYADEWDNPE